MTKTSRYASADVFLFPSTTETYGNVLVEAMASGLCPVAFDYAACAEIVEHGRNGLAVPLHDDDAFIQASLTAVRDADVRQRIARAALAVRTQRRWESVVASFQSHLFEAINARGHGSRAQGGVHKGATHHDVLGRG